MSDGPFKVLWAETAAKMVQSIPDRRIRRLIHDRAGRLNRAPEQKGKALIGELAGFRSVRAVGQRYRIIYRVDRRDVLVAIVAAGRRKEGDRTDIYELAKKLVRQRLLR